MFPACRKDEYLYTIPECRLSIPDVEAFAEELRSVHKQFAECFVRSELCEHFYHYMVGQLSQLERKSIEPIAVNVSGKGTVRSMQRAVSDAVWDEPKMLARYHAMVAEEMGEPDGVVMFDESGFVKKGKCSAGVARQYCGTIGKVENCQVGVFMGYASRQGYTLVDKRVFFPEPWFEEAYADTRKQCAVPEGVSFHTKPQYAAEMLLDCYQQGILPVQSIVADTLYGNSVDFIEAAEKCIGTTYCVSMPADTQCWQQRPLPSPKTYRYKGALRTKRMLKAPKKAPITFAQFATGRHQHFWYPRTVAEGPKGPIEYAFARRRMTLAKDGLPYKTVWLVIKRSLEDTPTYWYYVSNASTSARLELFVWLSGMRWPVEQCFEESTGEFGMDHDEVRKYAGWHHHILTCLLAHFFCGSSSSHWDSELPVLPCLNCGSY
jgi:SRSO17 transposase